jgi:hypothetical protein
MVGFLFLAGEAAAATLADAPPKYEEGDSWVFRVKTTGGTISTSVDGDHHVTYTNGKFESDLPLLLQGPTLVTVYISNDERPWLQFPMYEGKKWAFRYFHRGIGGARGAWRSAQATAVKNTVVRTLAGEFSVLEILREDVGGPINLTATYWYNTETKCIVKLTALIEGTGGGEAQKIEMELVQYRVNQEGNSR